jgi:hypothetical protein
MNAHSGFAKGRLRDWLRRAAAVLLLVASVVLVLQTTAHAGMSVWMTSRQATASMLDHHCSHSGAKADASTPSIPNPCSPSTEGLGNHGDSCEQLCAMTVVLPDPLTILSSAGRNIPDMIWTGLWGHSAGAILRPPRRFAVAS